MKKIANILLMGLSVFVLLIAPYIPHHHHEGLACMIMERYDSFYSDEHADDAKHNDDNSLCVENSKFLAVKSAATSNACNTQLFPLLIAAINVIRLSDVHVEVKLSYGEYLDSYKFADISYSNGLRAPPYSVS